MRKRLCLLLLVILACLATLTGCSLVSGAEKDVQVILEVNGEYVGCYTVNIFNNAVIPEPTPPEGLKFYGWSPEEDWAEKDPSTLDYIAYHKLVRYDDIKGFLKGDSKSVTLYAVFGEPIFHDLAIAWYAKTGTSGLDGSAMSGFQTKLNAYLVSEGYDPSAMDIVVRGYDGDVGTTCAEIMRDADINIMVGWAANITTTGGMSGSVKENISGVTIGSKERYAARLTDGELCTLVYAWIQNEYGKGAVVPPVVDPTITYDLKIAWYDRDGTSYLTQDIMDAFEVALNVYLAENGNADKKVLLRRYDGNVATSCAAIMTDADIDIMVGWAANITSTATSGGKMPTEMVKENVSGVAIGSAERYAARLTDGELCTLVYAWIQNEYGKGVVQPDPEPDPEPDPDPKPDDPIVEYDLIIAWYDKESTSGLTQETISAFQEKLIAYLKACDGEKYGDVQILLRGYDGNVSTSCAAIMTDADIDIMVGWAANITSTATSGGKMPTDMVKENVDGVAIGSAERYAARLTDGELCTLVYAWIQNEYGKGVVQPEPEPDPEPEPTPEPIAAHDVVIGWWNNSSSGLTDDIMTMFVDGLRAYLTSLGYDMTSFNITVRAYEGNLAKTAPMIIDDGDVNIVLGYGVNLKSTGGVDYADRQDGITMGKVTGRYIYQLTADEFSKFVFEWMKTDEAKALLITNTEENA